MTTNISGITICPFTGLPIDPNNVYDVPNKMLVFGYSNKIIGKVEMPHPVYISIYNKYIGEFDDNYNNNLYIYIGIIRNHFANEKTPFYVNSDFIETGYKEYSYPSDFNDKARYFLKYLYKNGGNEGRKFQIALSDYPLAYAKSDDEFQRIIEKLIKQEFIDYVRKPSRNMAGVLLNFSIELTHLGEKEVEKNLPMVPLFDLVNQDVFSGDSKIDSEILHAKKLFFKTDSTFNDKRSACEALSFVLEPIRKDFKKVVLGSDVEAFFNIVNNFDIRHNKDTTKSIEHEEQLEWIFYSLLNSIICYYKLWKK
jgi:hypothetical protein